MALPTREEIIRRKKVMLAAGIHVPNLDGSWGPWWNSLWKKACTHTKDNDYYGNPSVWNTARKAFNDLTGNDTYWAEPLPIGGTLQATDNSTGAQVKRTLNNWQHQGDPVRDVVLAAMPGGASSKVVKVGKAVTQGTKALVNSASKLAAKKITAESVKQAAKNITKESVKQAAKTAGKTAGKAAIKTTKAIVKETPKVVGGYLIGQGVEEGTEAITGKSWSELAADKMSDIAGFHIEPIFGQLTNPGYYTGYNLTNRIYQPIYDRHLLPRMEGLFDYLYFYKNKYKPNQLMQTIENSFDEMEMIDIGGFSTSIHDNKPVNLVYMSHKNPKGGEPLTLTKVSDGSMLLGSDKDLAMYEIRPSTDMIVFPHLGNSASSQVRQSMPKSHIIIAGNYEKLFLPGTYIGDGITVPWALIYRNNGLKAMFKKKPLLTHVEKLPYSYDSYLLLLLRANKPNYELRYSGEWFSPNNYAIKNTIDTSLSLTELLKELNNLIKTANPNAKLAKIINGEIKIPHAWLIKTAQ